MSGATPRIHPGGVLDVGLLAWTLSQGAGVATGTTAPNLFLTLGRNRRLFAGWLHFAGRLMPGGRLPRRLSELVILRVAHVRGCTYEFDHHVRLGRRAGVESADVDRVAAGPSAPGWSPQETAVLGAVDMLLAERDLDDATWASLREHLDESRTIELLLLVGHYDMLATTINTLRIQPDSDRKA